MHGQQNVKTCQIGCHKEQLEFALHIDCRNLPTVWARVLLEIFTFAQLVSWSVVTSSVHFSPGNY